MIDQIRTITADDLAQLEASDQHFEVVREQLKELTMAGELHGAIEANLLIALGSYVKTHQLGRVYPGDTTFILEGDATHIITARMPDVAFVARDRLKTQDRDEFYVQAPNLAIEIISPSERVGEIEAKLQDYLKAGVQQIWQVYPDAKRVMIFTPHQATRIYEAGQVISGGELLSGFEIAVDETFNGET